jgi:hypothetical protein
MGEIMAYRAQLPEVPPGPVSRLLMMPKDGYGVDAARAFMNLRDDVRMALIRGDFRTAERLIGACLTEAAALANRATADLGEAVRIAEGASRVLAGIAREQDRIDAERREIQAARETLAEERRRLAAAAVLELPGTRDAAAVEAPGGTRKSRRGHPRPPTAILPDLNADLRPDPARAASPAELMGLLRDYRVWAGNPSFRAMAAGTSPKYTSSALHAALQRDDMPRQLAVVTAIIQGCGGPKEDQRAWATAWRRLAMHPGSGVPLASVITFPEPAGTAQ